MKTLAACFSAVTDDCVKETIIATPKEKNTSKLTLQEVHGGNISLRLSHKEAVINSICAVLTTFEDFVFKLLEKLFN